MTNSLLKVIKETAIDCQIHADGNENDDLSCYNPTFSNNDELLFYPDISKEEDDSMMRQNRKNVILSLKKVIYNKKNYAWDERTQRAYDYDAYIRNSAEPVFVGTFLKNKKTGKMSLKEAV